MVRDEHVWNRSTTNHISYRCLELFTSGGNNLLEAALWCVSRSRLRVCRRRYGSTVLPLPWARFARYVYSPLLLLLSRKTWYRSPKSCRIQRNTRSCCKYGRMPEEVAAAAPSIPLPLLLLLLLLMLPPKERSDDECTIPAGLTAAPPPPAGDAD